MTDMDKTMKQLEKIGELLKEADKREFVNLCLEKDLVDPSVLRGAFVLMYSYVIMGAYDKHEIDEYQIQVRLSDFNSVKEYNLACTELYNRLVRELKGMAKDH